MFFCFLTCVSFPFLFYLVFLFSFFACVPFFAISFRFLDLGGQGGGGRREGEVVRNGPFEGDPAFMFFISFFMVPLFFVIFLHSFQIHVIASISVRVKL